VEQYAHSRDKMCATVTAWFATTCVVQLQLCQPREIVKTRAVLADNTCLQLIPCC
jgi:hypothetical protein